MASKVMPGATEATGAAADVPQDSHGLRRAVGVWGSYTWGYADVGADVYVALGIVMAAAQGATNVAFLFAGLVYVMVGLAYTELAAAYPMAGGGQFYVLRGLGDFWGFVAGWAVLLDFTIDISLFALASAGYINFFHTANLHSLNDGPITSALAFTDAEGNTASATGNTVALDTDKTETATLTVADTLDHVINNSESTAVSFTVAGLDDGGTGTVTFSDGVNPDVVVTVTGNGTHTANLHSLNDGPITSALAFTDAEGNTASATGNTVADQKSTR